VALRHELSAEDGLVQQAGLLPNPSLSVERVDTRRATRETTVLLSQPLELGGQRAARVQAAQRGREGVAALLAQRRAEVRAATAAAWFAVLAAQQQLALAQQAGELAQRAASTTGRRWRPARCRRWSRRAQVAASTVQLELIRAQAALATARVRLAAQWGNPAPRFERAAGAEDAAGEAGGLAACPSCRRWRRSAPCWRRRRACRWRRPNWRGVRRWQVERSRRVPEVALTVGSKRSEELGRSQAVLGLSLPLPLFDRNQGAELAALRRVEQARDGGGDRRAAGGGTGAGARRVRGGAGASPGLAGRDFARRAQRQRRQAPASSTASSASSMCWTRSARCCRRSRTTSPRWPTRTARRPSSTAFSEQHMSKTDPHHRRHGSHRAAAGGAHPQATHRRGPDEAGHADEAKAAPAPAAARAPEQVVLSAAQIAAAGIVVAPAPAPVSTILALPGEIRFNEDRTAHVVPKLAGVVTAVHAQLGQAVRRGQLLAVVASSALSEQRSELLAAQKRLALARTTLERERQLWQDKISAEQDYLHAKQAHAEAELAVQNARQKLSALGAGAAAARN
jgi:biotin carboxyl carrier protein